MDKFKFLVFIIEETESYDQTDFVAKTKTNLTITMRWLFRSTALYYRGFISFLRVNG